MTVEHVEGGYYTSQVRPCRCESCRADHTARARDYRRRVHPSQPDKLKLQIAELQSELEQMKAWAQAVPTNKVSAQ